ncbi:MAG: trypsin-like peptidase domain-containing protein [Nitrososphaera sp.]
MIPVPEDVLVNAVEKAAKSVVNIASVRMLQDQLFRVFPVEGVGSGVVIDEKGYILTNNHVIDDAERLKVTLTDGRVLRGRVVGSDEVTDLAVIKVEAEQPLPAAELGNSDELKAGQIVMAIGNPFGLTGGPAVTAGIISSLNRSIQARSGVLELIQTDAAINPGNSGGPLINMEGKVIGVNSAIYTTTGQFAGVGFALPSNTVSKVASSIIATGSFRHPWLGVSGTNITPGIAKSLKLDEPRGFLVVDVVSGSPAEKAGIQGGNKRVTIDGRPVMLGGDVIIGIDDTTVRKIDDVLVYLDSEKNVGDKVKLVVIRDSKVQEIVATLGARPGSFESP